MPGIEERAPDRTETSRGSWIPKLSGRPLKRDRAASISSRSPAEGGAFFEVAQAGPVLLEEMDALSRLERSTERASGSQEPLLVSVRSGARPRCPHDGHHPESRPLPRDHRRTGRPHGKTRASPGTVSGASFRCMPMSFWVWTSTLREALEAAGPAGRDEDSQLGPKIWSSSCEPYLES